MAFLCAVNEGFKKDIPADNYFCSIKIESFFGRTNSTSTFAPESWQSGRLRQS